MDRYWAEYDGHPGSNRGNDSLENRSGKLADRARVAYLRADEHFTLNQMIRGRVAFMTATRLSVRYDVGLENNELFAGTLARFRELMVRSDIRVAELIRFLDTELPADQPSYVKPLFLEAVARMIGREWVRDESDFTEVTIISSRLQEVIIALTCNAERNLRVNAPHVAVLTLPGEQHTLGSHLVGLLFTTLGWSTRIVMPQKMDGQDIARAVSHCDVICLSWSNVRLRGQVTDVVRKCRKLVGKRSVPLIAGGVAALDSIEFLVGIGVDSVCDSVYSAARICENYLELQRSVVPRMTAGLQRFEASRAGALLDG